MPRRSKGLSFYQKERKIDKDVAKEILLWLFWGMVMILLAFAFVYLFGIRTSIIGNSMSPLLLSGQEVMIDRFTYFISDPKKDDVIVFLPNGNENSHMYVKRVIGTPGDTVLIKDGMIYVNGEIYDRNGLFDRVEDGGIAENGLALGDNEYFVLGDNLNDSEDSRSGNVGTVKKDYILGKVWFALAGDTTATAGFVK